MNNEPSQAVCVGALCPSQQYFSHVGTFSCPLGLNSANQQRIKCLAQGNNTLISRSLELATRRTQVKHSTTEPLHSSNIVSNQEE